MRRYWLIIIIILLIATMASVALGYYLTEFDKKPIVSERIDDVGFIYDFYISSRPDIENRPYLGNQNASISIVVYLEHNNTSSRFFYEELFPQIKIDYIDTGKARFYHKNHVSIENFKNDEPNYRFAEYLECHWQTVGTDYYQLIFSNISDPVSDCTDIPETLKQDISEVENFGMVGLSPRIYIGIMGHDYTIIDGIPSYNRLRRTILNYQTQLGD